MTYQELQVLIALARAESSNPAFKVSCSLDLLDSHLPLHTGILPTVSDHGRQQKVSLTVVVMCVLAESRRRRRAFFKGDKTSTATLDVLSAGLVERCWFGGVCLWTEAGLVL